ncbi:GNAT family N-acetyltransferase [Flavobacterium sp. Sd200]|nr:GNAT family N-acetyltransferase [Flavobacterium sp. Sd200]
MNLRAYQPEDIEQIVALFRNTIHTINIKDYSQEQVNAWAPETIDAQRWGAKLLEHYTVVAQYNNIIIGFGDLHSNGYFDHLFTHKDYQGIGVASKIVEAIEAHAKQEGIEVLKVHVSITARTFFISKGYSVVKPQQVEYNGQVFTNYVMQKNIQ